MLKSIKHDCVERAFSEQGMLLLAASACIPGLTPGPGQAEANWLQNTVLYSSLYIVALGTGGIKPNVSAFGADQFDESDPQARLQRSPFGMHW